MAVILVTGASGQLGNELKVTSKNYFGYEYIFTDVAELDITDSDKVREFIKINGPDWIINCAAYNLVDKAESEYEKSMKVNTTGVLNLADSIKGSETRLIHLSTDYVFDGRSNVPYNEYSPANPLSQYGRTKLAGEKNALIHHGTMILRTSWLYSSFGNNFLKTILANGTTKESLKVVFDQTGTPTYASDLANTIMYIISRVIRNQIAFNAGIYHYSNEGVCTWYDFAYEIAREAGLKCKVIPVLSKEYPSPAKRPPYSVLDKSKIKENYEIEIPHWRTSMKKCLGIING
jgi:dTDP-4-dehydrorhamnose reductase